MLKKSTRKINEISREKLISIMKKHKPNKFELYMTKNFGSKFWTPIKKYFVLTELLLFGIGGWSTVYSYGRYAPVATFLSKFGTFGFAGLLVLLAIFYYTAAIIKRFRFGRISKELKCSISDVNYWTSRYNLTEDDVL
jgi:hypothetical protein